jgi:hypothetical protein
VTPTLNEVVIPSSPDQEDVPRRGPYNDKGEDDVQESENGCFTRTITQQPSLQPAPQAYHQIIPPSLSTSTPSFLVHEDLAAYMIYFVALVGAGGRKAWLFLIPVVGGRSLRYYCLVIPSCTGGMNNNNNTFKLAITMTTGIPTLLG